MNPSRLIPVPCGYFTLIRMPKKIFCLALSVLGFLLLPVQGEPEGASGFIEDYQPLLENSPFLSLAFKERLAKAGASGADKILFTGYAFVEDEWILCLEPEAGKPHQWLKLGDSIGGHTIESFDPDAQSITLQKGSVQSKVPLQKP